MSAHPAFTGSPEILMVYHRKLLSHSVEVVDISGLGTPRGRNDVRILFKEVLTYEIWDLRADSPREEEETYYLQTFLDEAGDMLTVRRENIVNEP